MTKPLETVDSGPGLKPGSAYRIVLDQNGQHYRLSNNGYETLAFPCDADGDVTDWTEIAGRMHGGQSLDEVEVELAGRLSDPGAGTARDENIEALGGPVGAIGQCLEDIAEELR